MPALKDQEQYSMEMLDSSNPNHSAFIEEFRNKVDPNKPAQGPKGMKVYRKAEETEDYFFGPSKKNDGGPKGNYNNNANKQHTPTPDGEEVNLYKHMIT